MDTQIERLSDDALDTVSGGLRISLSDIISAVETVGTAITDGVCVGSGGIHVGGCDNGPTNAEVYAPFFNGIKKGMGK